jgi:hypothetical protein
MIKNKKANTLFVMLMLGVLFFLLGLALSPALQDITDDARGTTGLNCSSPSITDQQKAICTSVDMQQALFIGVIFGLAGLLLGRMVA